jgi:hypothetical protein
MCPCVVGAQELREKLADAQQQVQSAMQDPSKCLAFLRPGRIIRVKEGQVCRCRLQCCKWRLQAPVLQQLWSRELCMPSQYVLSPGDLPTAASALS